MKPRTLCVKKLYFRAGPPGLPRKRRNWLFLGYVLCDPKTGRDIKEHRDKAFMTQEMFTKEIRRLGVTIDERWIYEEYDES